MGPDMRAALRTVVGVDLGGTKIEAVVAEVTEASADVRVRRRAPTERDRGYDAVLSRAVDLVRAVAVEGAVDLASTPVGVSMPGGTTPDGLVKNSNTTCLNGRPFRRDLAAALGARVTFENDANCFALAEATLGAGAGHRDGVVFGVILGSGVGGGLVVRGELWSGRQGVAGEWGHHAVFADRDVPCYCGQRGCLERFASGPAVEDDYARRGGARLPLAEIAARRADDPHARAAIEGLVEAFARGLANVIAIVDPSVVVLGGGVSNLALLYDEGARRVAEIAFLSAGDAKEAFTTPILQNALGDSAGVIGAALLA
jgi:fructokinase